MPLCRIYRYTDLEFPFSQGKSDDELYSSWVKVPEVVFGGTGETRTILVWFIFHNSIVVIADVVWYAFVMHEGLWEQLKQLDRAKTARRAGCKYVFTEKDPMKEDTQSDSGAGQEGVPDGYWVITFLNRRYEIDPTSQVVRLAELGTEAKPAGFLEQLCILAYLIQAQDIPLSGTLVRAEQFGGGEFFFRGIHALPTGKLAEALSQEPALLFKASQALGGRNCEYGDASIEIYVLPRLPMTVIIWADDEEFCGRASILFDRTASDQIALDALGAGVNLAVKAIVNTI